MYAGDALTAWLIVGFLAIVCLLLHATGVDDDDSPTDY